MNREATNLDNILDESRLKTLKSIKKVSNYDDGLNIYEMDVQFEYSIEDLTPKQITDTQDIMDQVFHVALPGIQVDYTAPDYGCSVFTLKNAAGEVQFGRNYDFKFDSSAMIVHCHPEDGYASVAHAALNNVCADDALANTRTQMACLTSPFICIDGINEKGVGVAVLTLDSDPVSQDSGKPKLATTMLIRLVLDKAASTAEAIELLKQYDMYAISGRDYHFYITDKSGDSRIVEFDCHSKAREMHVTETDAATNFYIMYKDKVQPNQKNGIYGHGRERYDAIEKILTENNYTGDTSVAWQAIKVAAQEPNPESITSNTQWSAIYNLDRLDYEFVLHRRWEDIYRFKL